MINKLASLTFVLAAVSTVFAALILLSGMFPDMNIAFLFWHIVLVLTISVSIMLGLIPVIIGAARLLSRTNNQPA